MHFAAALALALCGQLSFSIESPGIEPQLVAIKAARPSGWGTWGIMSWDQNQDGRKDILVTHHTIWGGILFRQNENGTFTDVTASLGVTHQQLPVAARPALGDFNGDGILDLGGLGLTGTSKVVINNLSSLSWPAGNSTLIPIGQEGKALNINGDNYADAQLIIGKFGRTRLRKAINNHPNPVFTYTDTELPLPEEFPQALKDNLATYTTAGGPVWKYATPDFCVVQYFSTYDVNEATRFGRYLMRDAQGVLQDVTATCGLPGNAVPMLDSIVDHNGDGLLDIILSHKFGLSGLYVQGPAGTFTKHTNAQIDYVVQWNNQAYEYKCLLADFDSDGDSDMILHAQRHGYADVFERTASGYTKWGRIWCWDAEGIEIADMTGDGKPDILVGGSGPVSNSSASTSVLIYRNTSAGAPPPPPPPPPPGVLRVILNDIEQPQGTTATDNGVPLTASGTTDRIIVITTP